MIIVGHFPKRAIYYFSSCSYTKKIANLFGLNCVSRNGNSRRFRDLTKLRREIWKKQNILM